MPVIVATSSPPGNKPIVQGAAVLLRQISWDAYQTLLHEIRDDSARLTYDDGFLEIEVPGKRHEEFKKLSGAMVEAALNARRIEYAALGSATWNQQEKLKGIEADECYYIGPSAAMVRGKEKIDTKVDPAPDLAIEVDVTASSIDKLRVYAAIGVKEVWRIDETGSVTMVHLDQAGVYQPISRSVAVPEIDADTATRHLGLIDTIGHARALWHFTDALPIATPSRSQTAG